MVGVKSMSRRLKGGGNYQMEISEHQKYAKGIRGSHRSPK